MKIRGRIGLAALAALPCVTALAAPSEEDLRLFGSGRARRPPLPPRSFLRHPKRS